LSEPLAAQDGYPDDAKQKFLEAFFAGCVAGCGHWRYCFGRIRRANSELRENHPNSDSCGNSRARPCYSSMFVCCNMRWSRETMRFPRILTDWPGRDPVPRAPTFLRVSRLNYRFAYILRAVTPEQGRVPAVRVSTVDANGQPTADATSAEYFANEEGWCWSAKTSAQPRTHIEPFLGMPKTLQFERSLVLGSRLPTDQPGILSALGPEGSPGYSTVPKGYQRAVDPEDNRCGVVWTNLSEGYLYSYRPEHKAAPAALHAAGASGAPGNRRSGMRLSGASGTTS